MSVHNIQSPSDLIHALGLRAITDEQGNVAYRRPEKVTIKATELAKFGWPNRIILWANDIHLDGTRTPTFHTVSPLTKNERVLCHSQAITELYNFPSGVDLRRIPKEVYALLEYDANAMVGGSQPWAMVEFDGSLEVIRIKAGSFNEAFAAFIDPNYDPEATTAREFIQNLPLEERLQREAQVKSEHRRRMENMKRRHLAQVDKATSAFNRVTRLF